uniref:Uncharacterized protein n=1 Tax=Romanomermis culicivorax TaxID=13658 RepID=A0A915L287_ROMCU
MVGNFGFDFEKFRKIVQNGEKSDENDGQNGGADFLGHGAIFYRMQDGHVTFNSDDYRHTSLGKKNNPQKSMRRQ